MSTTDSFADLKVRLAADDPSAPAEIVRRYAEQLVRLAAPRMTRSLARKVNPEDLVQWALTSFFRADPARAFTLDSWDNLWALLAKITLRKCRAATRHFLTLGRDLKRELALAGTDSSAEWEAVAQDPTPAEAATATDLVEQLLAGAEDDKAREIIELALAGHTRAEIAKAVGLTERSVYRKLDAVRKQLLQLDPDAAGGG